MAVALICVLGILVHFVMVGYRVAIKMDEWERRSHTLTQVCDAVAIYMDENNGHWPTSWENLATIEADPPDGICNWDNEYDTIQEMVKIDFSVDPVNLVGASWDSFNAIEPNGGVYDGFLERSYSPLIEKIDHYHK